MGRKSIQTIAYFVLYTVLLSACVKDKPNTPAVTHQSVTNDYVYIVCEGNFGNGDGSLYGYDVKGNAVSGDLYKAANYADLGDVFQSMARIGDKLFLCINNSDKVVVINNNDKKLTGAISIPKPRYVLPLSATKAYVSSLYSNKVYVINPQTFQVTGTIQMPYQNAEGMTLYNGSVYVCLWDTACHNIYAIDTSSNQIVKAVAIQGAAPQEAVIDKNNMLWVLSGNVTKGKSSSLNVLNAQGDIVKLYQFTSMADVIKPVFDKSGENLYFIEVNYNGGLQNNGIFKMNIADDALPVSVFIPARQYQYFWALGIHPLSGKVYVGDPKGFTQKGSILVYDADGIMTTQFSVGVGPGHFYFDN